MDEKCPYCGDLNCDSESCFWHFVRDRRKEEKEKYDLRVWPVIKQKIENLRKLGYKVRQLTDYQYRINGVLDIYPENQRYHDIKKNKRGGYHEMVSFVTSRLSLT